MYKGFLHTHYLVVILFVVIYLIKTILLLGNRADGLARFTKLVKVPEMIVSALFLITGFYLLFQAPVIKPLMFVKISIVVLSIPLAIVGFKKGNKILATLSFFMIIAAFGMGEAIHKQGVAATPMPAPAVEGANGAQALEMNGNTLYTSYCATCHGADGKLGMAGAADLSKTTLDKAGIQNVIEHGKGIMPAVQGLTAEQAAAVAEHVFGTVKK